MNPRCPNDTGENSLPEDDSGRDGVSHPSAREVPGGDASRRVNSFTVPGFRIGAPPCNMHSAKRATSVAGAKTPGMSGDSAHHVRVLVVHLALDDALAKSLIVLGRRDRGFPIPPAD